MQIPPTAALLHAVGRPTETGAGAAGSAPRPGASRGVAGPEVARAAARAAFQAVQSTPAPAAPPAPQAPSVNAGPANPPTRILPRGSFVNLVV